MQLTQTTMLFDIPFVADWKQIGEYRLHQTDHSNKREKQLTCQLRFQVGDKILIRQDGILRKAESISRNPWTIMTVHTNETIRIQCGTKSERINT